MSCNKCGARCRGRFCKECARDDHRKDDHETTDTDTKTLQYECSDCQETYRSDGPGQCPHCGNWGARAIPTEACA